MIVENDPLIKYYVDSDGVIADFASWVRKTRPDLIESTGTVKDGMSDELHRFMVENYKECYLTLDLLPEGEEFLNQIRAYDNWFVLTASLNVEKIKKFVQSKEEAIFISDVFFENKYRWYEGHGVSRDKVIITPSRNDKKKYAQGRNVLFDDFIDNINDWRKAGGIAYQIGNRLK